MRLKKTLILPILTILAINLSWFAYSAPAELIEKIYAVVNGELITYSELKLAENEMSRVLRQQYQDNEELLKQNLEEMKKNLLERLIEQKMILSVAKERNYDVEPEIEIILKDIKKQNNIGSDEELKQAIEAQGMDYTKWQQQLKETSMQHRLIREEIGYKIKIDNSQIMEYYKQNMKDYTKPMEFSINCIYLDKAQALNEEVLAEKRRTIDSELQTNPFVETAKKYSQLPGTENNYYLGRYKTGELNAKIEEAASKLDKEKYSSWIETDTGWYIIQILERKEPELMEYKAVRSEIEETLMAQEQNVKLKDYVEQLKKDSHIKILEEYK